MFYAVIDMIYYDCECCHLFLEEAQRLLVNFSWDPPIYELAVKALDNESFCSEEGVLSSACGLLEALCSSGKCTLVIR